MKNLNALRDACYQNAVDKGFHDKTREPGTALMLIVTELAEAMEDVRDDPHFPNEWTCESNGKPCGFPSELADVIIRVLDTAGEFGIDIEGAVDRKMIYNASRKYMHGGKTV